nr:carbohydrate kinase family protein [Candidatus Njordarchaeum guaymaensis]
MGEDKVKKFHLIGIGVLVEDLLYDTKHKHHITQEFEHDELKYICVESGGKEAVMQFTRSTGGSSANLVCGVSQLGRYHTGYFSKLGMDHVSKWFMEDLQRFGVNAEGIVVAKEGFIGPGASAIITDMVTRDRSILTYRGIGDEIDVKDVHEKEDYLRNAEWHTISSFSNLDAYQALEKILDIERENDIKLFFTPSMSMINPLLDETIEIAKQASLVALNDTEARLLAGTKDLQKAAGKIQGLGPEFVLVTRGKEGILAVDEERFYVADGTYSVQIRNTVGAGDVSGAALWHYLHKGLDKPSIIQRILAAGAIKIQLAGAKAGLPTEKEIEDLIKEKGEIPVQTRSR